MRVIVYIFIFLIFTTLTFYLLMWFRDKVIPRIEECLVIPQESKWYALRENLKTQLDEILYYYPIFIVAIVVLMLLVAIFHRQPESRYYYYLRKK